MKAEVSRAKKIFFIMRQLNLNNISIIYICFLINLLTTSYLYVNLLSNYFRKQ